MANARKKGKDDYLFQRGNRWYLKLQAPKNFRQETVELEPYLGHRTRVIALKTEVYVRNPTQAGHRFRNEAGRASDLMPDTIPK